MEKDSVYPTYIRKDEVQTQDPTYLGPPDKKKSMYVGIDTVHRN
jgi:hypothetical protein